MADSTQASELISSPLSTGGAGTFFEQHVGAFLLTSLLVRGIPPILLDCYVVEVSLQNERLGFHTDDFLLLGICADGTERRLLGQVKRSLTVSASNTDFKDAVTDCWRDFIGSKFSALTDRFALVTRRGSTVLLEYFGGLLECARTANDAEEFQTRLTTKGLLHKKSSDYYNEIKKIISEILEREATAVELWPFLRVLYILSLDLGTSTKQHESFAKNLLAHTCVVDDPIAAADSTWNALLREVGDGMGNARSFKYETLSKGLRKQHSPIQHQDHVALGQIEQHSAAILNRICTTLGAKQNIHLSRSALVQQLLDQIRLSKVVIVSGPAGSGKSAIAKDALLSLSINYFTFCFRADEFARAHFDETLRHSNVSVGAETLGAILGTQDRKILLIESIERLLEKSVREAFSDLLTLVREDPTWQIILTCRDYSTAQVKAFLLEAYGFDHAVIEIPGLSDDELNEVSRQCPSLTRPLENPSLRKLLRTPYFLDKAIQMPWPDGIAIPASERAFRKKFWIDIVQGSTTASGMQIDRERAFIEIALRRARALSMYADAADLDATVLQSLKSDSLISVSETSVDLVTPAHDVLEDWAVVHWIENGFLKCEGSLQKFSELIGTHPAVRRSYRKWISELLERDSSSADELFQSLVLDRSLPEQFGDDTLVCFLRSSHATVFLRRHERVLFENNKTLLLRIMHLLRVACVAPPLWLEIWKAQPSIFNAPDSEAWGAVLAIIKSNLDQFDKDTSSLLLGLIEDWSRAIGPNSPYPEGADSVSSIAYSLLEYFSAFGWSDQRKRTLKVIANIPKADPERFELMLRRKTELEERDLAPDEFRQIIFEDLDGMAACRDLPNLVMSTFLESLFTDEEKWTDGEFPEFFDDDFSLDNGRSFGLKRASNLDYFPASAFQGPFIQLLRHHFQDGVNFIISILNESGKAYKGAYASRGNSIHSTELTFPDQDKAVQICDSTLWNLYRGNSPTPSVLQSALMALEHVLLGYAEAGTKGLDRFLVSILRQSESVAVTAVAASVATAYPHQVPETLMVLLSSPECVILDRRRMSQDLTGSLSGLFPNLDTSKQIYFNERKIADSLLHRRNDLEFAVKSLQLGPSAESVAALIDKHLSNLPPLEEQREFEQTWRLALHRMDLRQYTIEPIDFDDPDTNETEKQAQYLVTAKPPADDLQGIVDKSTSEFAELNNILEFKMWGKKVFVGDDSSSFAPDQWKARLEQAKTISFDSPVDQFHAARKGAVSVAAVCIRYHWDKLEKHDQKWCIETVCTEIERDSDNWNRLDQVQREGPEGGRAAAWVLPSLVGKQSTERLQNRVLRCIALSITHAVHELRLYAAWGVGSHLWT
ncbi:MAG: hypothetical protein K8F91_07005, partial [Candidatus Obscuribacterales bacterium]|nr:hypothetical protein [Candidatus Obscuribacterales bacterium]